MPHRYPTRYQAKKAQASMTDASDIKEDCSVMNRALLEFEAHKNAREHTKAIRTAISLFRYIEMHPRIFTYDPRLKTIILTKIVETQLNGKRIEHDIHDWNTLMAVCSRVCALAQ
jgi:hypothetical protein